MNDIKNNIQYLKLEDIPENINEELKRLHEIIKSDAVWQRKDWAQNKIEHIHSMLFSGVAVCKSESQVYE